MPLREYCQRLGISRRTAYRQLASGKLAGRKLPGGGWRISEGECARLSGEEQESLSAQIKLDDLIIARLQQLGVLPGEDQGYMQRALQ